MVILVKRSIYLINPKFQLKFAMFVSTFVFLPSLVYPWTIYELIEKLVARVGGPEQIRMLEDQRVVLIVTLAAIQLAFTALVFIICIFHSHKIAGPLYKLRTYFQTIIDGNVPDKLFFRKGDNFQELAEDFNNAFGKVQETYNQDFAYLKEVNTYIENLALIVPDDKKPVINEITAKLSEIQDRFKIS